MYHGPKTHAKKFFHVTEIKWVREEEGFMTLFFSFHGFHLPTTTITTATSCFLKFTFTIHHSPFYFNNLKTIKIRWKAMLWT